MRSVIGATTIAFVLPMIDAYGAAVTYLLFTLLMWISYGYVVVLKIIKWILIMTSNSVSSYIIKYGDELRAGIDIKFSVDNSKLPDST